MNEHPDAQDRLQVRGLLAETGIDESPELLAGLLALRAEGRGSAPEPTGKLAALLDGTPVPLKSKRRRGIILSTALVGAMAAGATGVAANPDFLVRADPTPAVSFMPEDAPTLERSTAEAVAPEETAAPAVQAPDAAAPAGPEVPAPAVPVPQDPAPAPAAPAAPLPAPAPVEHPGQGLTHPGGRGGAAQLPVIPVPEPNHRADGAHRYIMGPGNGAALFGGRDPGWGQGQGYGYGYGQGQGYGYGQGNGYGYGYGGYQQDGRSGWGR